MRLELLSQIIVASGGDSSSGDPRAVGLLFFLSGFIFYGFVYLRYRNTDKRHRHESETEAKMVDVRAADQLVGTLTDLEDSKMKGANNHDVRAGNRGTAGGWIADAVNTAAEQIPGGRDLLR